MKNKSFFTLLLCLVLPAYTQAYTPKYDSNAERNHYGDISVSDNHANGFFSYIQDDVIIGVSVSEGDVDMFELAMLAHNWLLGTKQIG